MRWNPKSKPNPEKVNAIQQALQVDEIIATLCYPFNLKSSKINEKQIELK